MKKPAFLDRSPLGEVLWGFRREFLAVGLFSAVCNLLLLTPTIYMLQVYDHVMISGSELTLLAVSLVCLFLFGVMTVSDWTRSRILVRAGVRLDEALSTRVFNSSFEAYLDSTRVNPQRAFSDLLQVRQFITGNGVFALFDAPWTPVYIFVMFLLHPLLGWVSIGFAMIQIALAWFGHRHTVAPAEAAQRAGTDVNVYVQGKLRNAEVLESMGMVHNLRARWRVRQAAATQRMLASHHVNGRVQAISKFVRYAQQSLALATGAVLVVRGELSPGAMIASNILMNRALGPIDMLVTTWRSFFIAKAAFERLEKLLLAYPERDSATRDVQPAGEVAVRNLTATAPEREQPILSDVSFSIPSGTVVAVLGPSGSGKSTLARAMLGIWPHVSGEVLLDGVGIERWNRRELGPHIGYLPQDIELFDGTIAENIARFSKLDAKQGSQKVIEAATCAGLHQMILRFPNGYDTQIGEGGAVLSGGQKQRIALARAVFGDPSIIVLDEPNANLDDAGEAALINTIRELKAKGKTVFLITHRSGAVNVADWLLILRDGRVAANGPRDAVIADLQAQQQRAQVPASTQEPTAPVEAQPA